MRLAELSEATGVSPASIKFYLRSGLLHAGEAVNPTRAAYGEDHVRRLRLIQGLRSTVGLGLEDIRRIIDASHGADASAARRLALLATVQSVVLRLEATGGVPSPVVDRMVLAAGWPDEESEARTAVDLQIAAMAAAGVRPEPGVLEAYARAADGIALAQLSSTEARGCVEDVILTAAIGMHMHNQLILKIVALAQASHSIRRYGARGPSDVEGRDGDTVPALMTTTGGTASGRGRRG